MTNFKQWINNNPQIQNFNYDQWSRVRDAHAGTPNLWNSIMSEKIIGYKVPAILNPDKTIILGGMCLITTVEMKRILAKKIVFNSITHFENWFSSWYPRMDQLHDAVGIPPKSCKNLIYISEDSFFAGRLSHYTGLDKEEIMHVLRKVHDKQGHKVLVNYLRSFGYTGEIKLIYTSEIDKELEVGLKLWERILGSSFRTCDRDFAKVELMYTGFWLDILNIKTTAILYEPATKMILKGWLKLDRWFTNHPYGQKINHNLGIVGYTPFLLTKGDGSILEFNDVPNYGNYKNFEYKETDIQWYVTNLLYSKKRVKELGPLSLTHEEVKNMLYQNLIQYYV